MHAIADWWAAVGPNLEANIVWGAPAFAVHHVLLRRHVTRENAKTRREQT